jgi:hypothetical protein
LKIITGWSSFMPLRRCLETRMAAWPATLPVCLPGR